MIDPSLIKLLKSKASIDELTQAKDLIKDLQAANSALYSQLTLKELTLKTLLTDNARLQLDISTLKGDLSVSNMQVHSLVQDKASLIKILSDEEARNKQFAEEQIFNANRDKCRIYQLEREIKLLKEKLSHQQELSAPPNQRLASNLLSSVASPAPPSMQLAIPDKSQPLIPAARKGAFTYNLPPASTSKRKNVEPVMTDAGDSYAGSPAKISKEAIQKNGPMMFTFRVTQSAPRQNQIEQSASKKQITPRQFG